MALAAVDAAHHADATLLAFTCPYPGCAKKFSRHDNLNQHARVHAGEPDGAVAGSGSDSATGSPQIAGSAQMSGSEQNGRRPSLLASQPASEGEEEDNGQVFEFEADPHSSPLKREIGLESHDD